METVANHLRNASTDSTGSALMNSTNNNREERLSELLLERFFRAMQIEFGARWSSQFPTPESLAEAKLEWGKKLAVLSGPQIRAGLDAMDVGQTAWPLGPRGFVKLAKEAYHPSYVYSAELLTCKKDQEVDPEQQARVRKILADCVKSFQTNKVIIPTENKDDAVTSNQKRRWISDTLTGKCDVKTSFDEWLEFQKDE